MIEVAFRYMQDWTPFDRVHKDAKNLNANWSKAFEKLRYELARVNATNVVIEAGYKPDQVRADGWPYSNAKPEHSGVRVSFLKGGKLPLAFRYNGWKAVEMNVYMIALTLERLRAVERYGCTQSGQQYKGWAQLPPGANEGRAPIPAEEFASVEDAMRFLSRVADGEVHTTLPVDLDLVYKAAARKAHPDRRGGDSELMSKVNRARDYVARMAEA